MKKYPINHPQMNEIAIPAITFRKLSPFQKGINGFKSFTVSKLEIDVLIIISRNSMLANTPDAMPKYFESYFFILFSPTRFKILFNLGFFKIVKGD